MRTDTTLDLSQKAEKGMRPHLLLEVYVLIFVSEVNLLDYGLKIIR